VADVCAGDFQYAPESAAAASATCSRTRSGS
jgi:hypothetical protein